jgi:hypothetical protein
MVEPTSNGQVFCQASGEMWAGKHGQAFRQIVSKGDAVGGCLDRIVESLQLLPAWAYI